MSNWRGLRSARRPCGKLHSTGAKRIRSPGSSGLRREMLARPEGLEPPAYWFEASRSIRLSYGRVRFIVSSENRSERERNQPRSRSEDPLGRRRRGCPARYRTAGYA